MNAQKAFIVSGFMNESVVEVQEGVKRIPQGGAPVTDMTTFCAWCGKRMSGPEPPKGLVSHGICPECLLAFEENPDKEET
jgi:hypothetical protein